jgi:hypothetical protein
MKAKTINARTLSSNHPSGTVGQTACTLSGKTDFSRDIHQFGFLCELLDMFSRENGFIYNVMRKGAVVEIYLLNGKRTAGLHYSMDDSEPLKSANLRSIVHQIIDFAI